MRGDVLLGTAGVDHAASALAPLRIIRGFINSDGTMGDGEGYTAGRTGTGTYVITFSTPFSASAFTTVTAYGNATASLHTENNTSVIVYTYRNGGTI